ncbi:MAG: hypothetical protein Q9221_008769 [Calogaya cf. arnoldii]
MTSASGHSGPFTYLPSTVKLRHFEASTEPLSEAAECTEHGGPIFHAGEVNDWCKYHQLSGLSGDLWTRGNPDLVNFAKQSHEVIKATVTGAPSTSINGAVEDPIRAAAKFGLAAVKIYVPTRSGKSPTSWSTCSATAVKAPNGKVYIISCCPTFCTETERPNEDFEELKDGEFLIQPDDLAIYEVAQGQQASSQDQHTIELSDICTIKIRDPTTRSGVPYPAWIVGYAGKNEWINGDVAQQAWALKGPDSASKFQYLAYRKTKTPDLPLMFDMDYFSWRYIHQGVKDQKTRDIIERLDWTPEFDEIYKVNYRGMAVGCLRFTESQPQELCHKLSETSDKTIPTLHNISTFPGISGSMTCAFQGKEMSEPKVVGISKLSLPSLWNVTD